MEQHQGPTTRQLQAFARAVLHGPADRREPSQQTVELIRQLARNLAQLDPLLFDGPDTAETSDLPGKVRKLACLVPQYDARTHLDQLTNVIHEGLGDRWPREIVRKVLDGKSDAVPTWKLQRASDLLQRGFSEREVTDLVPLSKNRVREVAAFIRPTGWQLTWVWDAAEEWVLDGKADQVELFAATHNVAPRVARKALAEVADGLAFVGTLTD